mmetsp:Transcript_15980/g.16578  ORF Transcript_15980/g.16578 Transcript_15980/m.16578 type:complete len:111 (-) Transcript_15980:32-364(-)
MAGHQRRKHNLAKHKEIGKSRKTRQYKRDLDQVIDDLKPQNLIKLANPKIAEDKPGLGQFYCVWCSRDFISKDSLEAHQRSKQHKKRVKVTKEEPYTIKDSLRYGGINVD